MSAAKPLGADVVQWLRRPPQNPFPSTTVIACVTRLGDAWVGECFVLVENGKIYFNGRRENCPEALTEREAMDRVLKTAHAVVTQMATASTRLGVKAPSTANLDMNFEATEAGLLTKLCQRREYRPFLRWLCTKAASSALRQQIADALVQAP